MKRTLRVFALILCCITIHSVGAWADQEDEIMKTVAGAWANKDYATIFGEADRWLEGMKSGSIPKMGPNFQQLAFLIGYAGYQLVEDGQLNLSADEYQSKVVEPLRDYMAVNQKDYARNMQIMGKAMKRLFDLQEDKSPEVENETIWTLWRAVIESQKDEKFVKPVGEKTAGLVYQYVSFCMEIVLKTDYPDLYQYRIRHACQTGLGASPRFDEAFWTYYEMTYFDGGNIKCGVLRQKALEFAYQEDEEAIKKFAQMMKEAIDIAKTNKAKAELYRQLADNLSTVGGKKYMEEANAQARAAYRLDPFNKDIRDLYGTTLLLLANKSWQEKQYLKASKLAEEGTAFSHQNDHELFIILAKAQAFQGMKVEAIKNAQKGYQGACLRSKPEDLQFLESDYKSILDQFGESSKFRPCGGRKATEAKQ